MPLWKTLKYSIHISTSIRWFWRKKMVLMKGMWVAKMTLKGPCNLRIQGSRSNGNQGIGPPAKYSQLFEMEIRPFQLQSQIKANVQGVSRQCLSLFEAAHKGGERAFAWMKQDLFQPVSIFTFSTCWLGVVSSKQSDVGGWMCQEPDFPMSATPPPATHDSLSWYRWTWDWFKMTVSSSLRKRRVIQRSRQTSLLPLQEE